MRLIAAVMPRDLTKLYPASQAGVRDVWLDVAAGQEITGPVQATGDIEGSAPAAT
jgi:hypothetical protein